MKINKIIPLSIPNISGNELTYVKDCLETGWISSAGKYVEIFEEKVKNYVGSKYAIACMNGTSGLHVSQLVLGLNPGDHVITPNITFVATLNSIKYNGASPILVDVNLDDWQMDYDLLEEYLEHNTFFKNGYTYLKKTGKPIKIIMPVHVLGNVGDIDKLIFLAKKYNLKIIEDSAESLGSYHNYKHTGTFGDMGVFSFNGNKILSTGGGGIIVTNNNDLAKKARHLTTQAKISKEEYIHDKIGYNYRMVNILAAVGVAQMEQLTKFLDSKKNMDKFYRNQLSGVGDIEFQKVGDNVKPNCWLFTFRTKRMRNLLEFLNNNGIQSRPFWVPMNQLEMFKNDIYITKSDSSSLIYEQCLSIPSSSGITKIEQLKVVEQIKKFFLK